MNRENLKTLFNCVVILKKQYFEVPMATVAMTINSSVQINLHQSTIIWCQYQPLLSYGTEDILSQILSIVYVSMVIATMLHYVQMFFVLKFVQRAMLNLIMYFVLGISFSFYQKSYFFHMKSPFWILVYIHLNCTKETISIIFLNFY